ncbi:MAG: RNA polymerase sigma factor [Planctomycetota bacterium]
MADLLHEILERCRLREQSAFTELVKRFQDRSLDLARSLTEDQHLAEDVVQQAFLIAFCKLDQLKNDDAFPGWFRQIVRTQALRITRKKKANLRELRLPQESDLLPDQQIEQQELRNMIRQSLSELSKQNQQTTELFYFNEQSCGEVAKTLNIPSGTVRRRLHEARNQLRCLLKHCCEDTDTEQENKIPL